MLRQAGAALESTARASSLIVASGSVTAVATLVAEAVRESGEPCVSVRSLSPSEVTRQCRRQELINFDRRERNLLDRQNAIATLIAGPTDVTGAAVVSALVSAATVGASATVVARAVVISVVPDLIRIRSIVIDHEWLQIEPSDWGPQNDFPTKRLAERGHRMNQSCQRAHVQFLEELTQWQPLTQWPAPPSPLARPRSSARSQQSAPPSLRAPPWHCC